MRTRILLDLSAPQEKYLRVTYDFFLDKEFFPGTDLTLVFPAWTPGSYLVRDFAAHVEAFEAFDGKGRRLEHEKTAKNRWVIRRGAAEHIVVKHWVYANDLSVRAAYADHKMALANGPAVFFHPEGFLASPVALVLKCPRDWRLAVGAIPKNGVYEFADFDELYDTPVLAAGEMKLLSFRAGGTRYRMAVVGEHRGDIERVRRDIQKAVAKQNALFGDNPCRDYLFQLLFIKGGYGGLEHRASSTNIFDGAQLDDPKKYPTLIALLAHEHFHLWNVKRIRPKALGPFDYERENYTRELWIAEGVTSYYDDHSVLRAGVFTRQQYLDVVAENVEKFENARGSRVHSLSEASFDAWIKFYRPNENSSNRAISYYLKGGLVMMLLDLEIIRLSGGKHTLDDVMRGLYGLYKRRPHAGIAREEFFDQAKTLTKSDFGGFIADYIDGTKPIDWKKAFAPFGIDVVNEKLPEKHDHGLHFKEQDRRVTVEKVDEGSPAFFGPLQAGDELIAINGERLEKADQARKAADKAGLEIWFSRRGRVGVTRLEPVRNARTRKKFTVRAKGLSPARKKLLDRFLRS